jgi:Domain of unknown function (DUF4189)
MYRCRTADNRSAPPRPGRSRSGLYWLGVLALGVFISAMATTPSRADWMAYAVDGYGHFGHGRAKSPEQAREYALAYCGSRRCYVVMTSAARCVALATSNFRGFWVGTGAADSAERAAHFARRYCAQSAPWRTCHIDHTYCQ